MRPAANALGVDVLAVTGVPGGGDQPPRVLAARQLVQLVAVLDPIAEAAGVLGGLGRVLGDVARHPRRVASRRLPRRSSGRTSCWLPHPYGSASSPSAGTVDFG